jgi:hypothetical protein
LALKWAVTEKFKDYLAIQHVTVLTDNNPLTYILTSAKLDATGHRWASALGEFNFDIKYRAGYKNIDADVMSRLPGIDKTDGDTFIMNNSAVKAICNLTTTTPLIEILPAFNIYIVEVTEDIGKPLAQIEY